ncbi:16 kDa proteolipid subunit [Seminavis robusta]|uniref:V-type proton ATPase proteolipid subunit n=1 Tax=Seminavis robusta TaxID=568900 RepID=A0A9N8HHL6_9STRA|nr:16 kDa proteolipid subunit [Seminavis robusta]|eukprot:Sro543_g163430.1 16 kDa proteolipid subunit (209) ;mRNA; f:5297-6183
MGDDFDYEELNQSYVCASWAPGVGFAGITAAVVFANLGGAYGTAKAGLGIMAMGIRSPELLMKNIIPVVMAGVLGIYGLIVAVILNGKFTVPDGATRATTYSQYNAFSHLAAGLCVGLCSLASGLAIGISADAGTRAVGAQSAMAASWKKMGFTGDAGGQVDSQGDALFVGTILIQVFASNLGLYGLIAALILSQQDYQCEVNGGGGN